MYLVAAPTYPMLRDSSMRAFEAIARELRFLRDLTTTAGNARALLGNGAEVIFRSADVPDRLRGPNLSGAWFDEAGEMVEDAYLIAIACLREAGAQGWLSATFTPRGRQHWTYRTFGADRENAALFTARTGDNPFNPVGFEDRLRGQYTSAFAEQELAGKFVDLQGTVARREWFRVVDVAPSCARRVRAWDFAATPEDARGEGDYTAGALLGQSDAGWIVLDMVRARVAGGSVAALVKRTAEQDGRGVEVAVEEEPGATGKIAAAYIVRELAGWNVRGVSPRGDKLTRAMPLLAQAEAGNVAMVRAGWNAALLDELATFPGGAHDDQVDAAAHAFNLLAGASSGSCVLF
jgi:predicted phage terminase large subunit-like protein